MYFRDYEYFRHSVKLHISFHFDDKSMAYLKKVEKLEAKSFEALVDLSKVFLSQCKNGRSIYNLKAKLINASILEGQDYFKANCLACKKYYPPNHKLFVKLTHCDKF